MKTIKVADITTSQLLEIEGLFEKIISQDFEFIRFDIDMTKEHGYPDTIFRISARGIHTRDIDMKGKDLEFIKIVLPAKENEEKPQDDTLIDDTAANLWWENSTREIKALFSCLNDDIASEYYYRVFWNKLDRTVRNNLHQYRQYKKEVIKLSEDEANSLLMGIICELADIALETEFGKSREDMCDNDGSFYEEYQDRFNDLYDDMEDRILNYNF